MAHTSLLTSNLGNLATPGFLLSPFSEKRNDGPERTLVLLRDLDERETHIHQRTRLLPAIEIGPHPLAFDDDLLSVGKFDDHLVELIFGELRLAVDEYSARSDISGFTLNCALAGNDGNRPVHIDSRCLSFFAGVDQIAFSLLSLTTFSHSEGFAEVHRKADDRPSLPENSWFGAEIR